LDISAILRKVQKQKQMAYLGHVDNISAYQPIREKCCIGKDIDGFVKVGQTKRRKVF
jgi:hypothetical protein